MEAPRRLLIILALAAGALAAPPAASAYELLDDPLGYGVAVVREGGRIWTLLPLATAPDAYRPNGAIEVPTADELATPPAGLPAPVAVPKPATTSRTALRRCRAAAKKRHGAARHRALRRCDARRR